MATLKSTVEALIASRESDGAAVARRAFRTDTLGPLELAAISPDDVDAAAVRPAECGRLCPGRGGAAVSSGCSLAGSTVDRYVATLGGVYRAPSGHL